MQTLSEIRALLDVRGIRPKHRFGQNFLHDQNQIRRLLDEARIQPGDCVIEVGPGTGTLTEALLEAGANVIACEVDADMAAIVEERVMAMFPDRLALIQGDALQRQRELNPAIIEALGERTFTLIANLPYQIASPLMTTLLIEHRRCVGQFVTIQREVADRLTAKPSSKAYGPLTVIVQALATVEVIATLSPTCFWPAPDVVSAMVAIRPHVDSASRQRFNGCEREFARWMISLFTKRRKQLGTIVGRSNASWPQLERAGITQDLRPETLNVDQHILLWQQAGSSRP